MPIAISSKLYLHPNSYGAVIVHLIFAPIIYYICTYMRLYMYMFHNHVTLPMGTCDYKLAFLTVQ